MQLAEEMLITFMYDKFNNIKINFNKKKIIITGASRGIGKKICDDFKKLYSDKMILFHGDFSFPLFFALTPPKPQEF